MIGNDGLGQAMYLHTSPEFTMKKLLAAGETRIASLQHVWRNRERSALHHPEFTMLEWYRAGAPYDAIIADTLALIALAAETTGIAQFGFRGGSAIRGRRPSGSASPMRSSSMRGSIFSPPWMPRACQTARRWPRR